MLIRFLQAQSTARASPKRPPQHKHPQGHHNDSSIALSEQYHEQGCRSRDSECIISASCVGCAFNLNLTRLRDDSSGALRSVRVSHSSSFPKISAHNFQVTSEKGRSSVSLTGIGYLCEDYVRASDDSDIFYEDSDQGLKSYDLLHSDSNKPRTFGFHESCWQILLSQLESLTGRPQEPRRIAEPLFNLLFCLPRDRFQVSFQAHDFGGAFEICSSPKGLPQSWKFLLADPDALRIHFS